MGVRLLPALLLLAPFGAMAADEPVIRDKNGAEYRILGERPLTDALKAVTVEVESRGTVTLMEVALDCAAERYGYLGMLFDLPPNTERSSDRERVEGYSNSILTSRIGGLTLTALDRRQENEAIVALVDLGCETE